MKDKKLPDFNQLYLPSLLIFKDPTTKFIGDALSIYSLMTQSVHH